MNKHELTVVEHKGKVSLKNRFIVGSGVLLAAAPAFADGFDVTSIVTIITGFVAGVSAIGLAVLLLVVTGKVFKWVRTAL